MPKLLEEVFLNGNKEWQDLSGVYLQDVLGVALDTKIKEKYPTLPGSVRDALLEAEDDVLESLILVRGRNMEDLLMLIEDWRTGELWPMNQ